MSEDFAFDMDDVRQRLDEHLDDVHDGIDGRREALIDAYMDLDDAPSVPSFVEFVEEHDLVDEIANGLGTFAFLMSTWLSMIENDVAIAVEEQEQSQERFIQESEKAIKMIAHGVALERLNRESAETIIEDGGMPHG